MEQSEIQNDGAPPDASAPHDDSVSISSIFQEGTQSKKVIVLQSPGIENEDAIQVQGELPNLMDAVSQPGEVAPEQCIQLPTEITYEMNNQSTESVETVSASEETNNVPVADASNMEVTEYSMSQVITDQNIPEGQELIYLNPEDIKDQNVQFIDVSATNEIVTDFQGNVPSDAVAHAFQQAVADTEIGVKPEVEPKKSKPNQLVSKDDSRTRFLCPVCEKSFRQKHLLLCHIKLHDGRPKANSVYMSNCTTCGGNVRLTSEQARLLQERGTEDARIICSTCKILGHDVIQQQKSTPIELKPAYNFACDMCGCDIKLTDDQLQLVERKGAENIRIICAPCSTKDQDGEPEGEANSGTPGEELKCNVCHRTIVLSERDTTNRANPVCAECQAKGEDSMAVDNINHSDDTFTTNCTMCHKELFFAEKPPRGVKVVCESCKNKKLARAAQPMESPPKPVESLAVMYKCNNCFCNMQLSAEQKELLRVRGVCGTKIICASCHAKETMKPVAKKPRLSVRKYQCDICLVDMAIDYTPREDDDVICNTCRRVEEKEKNRNKISTVTKKPSNENKPQVSPTSNLNRCCTCNKVLPMSRAQLQKLIEKGGRARVKCLTCNRKTEAELKKTKTIIKTEEGVDYRCEICSISFGQQFDDFTEHFSRVHVPESNLDRSSKGLYKSKKPLVHCPICDAGFTDRANLKMHMNTHKPVERQLGSKTQKPCPLCCKLFDRAQMFEHYHNVHKINFPSIHYTFKSIAELKQWKTKLEMFSGVKFVAPDPRAKVVKGRPGVVVSLKCEHAVHRRGEPKGATVLCPAKMNIHEKAIGRYDVECVETHIGHGDLSNLPDEDQQLVVEMLKGGSSIKEIIEELGKHYNDPDSEDLQMSVSGLKSINLPAVCKQLGLELEEKHGADSKSFDTSDDDNEATDTDNEESVMRYVDLPESLSWLIQPTENGEDLEVKKSQNDISISIEDTGDGHKLEFRNPSNAVDDPLTTKKIEILRRLTDVLNKCSCDEHMEIIDVYLSPCVQTLNELTSGRRVEIVDEDSTPGDENPPDNVEEGDTSPQRSKNDLSDSNAT